MKGLPKSCYVLVGTEVVAKPRIIARADKLIIYNM